MRLTKNDMARVIVTALYNRPALVAADHPEVLRRAARGTVANLTRQHAMAVAAIQSVQRTSVLDRMRAYALLQKGAANGFPFGKRCAQVQLKEDA